MDWQKNRIWIGLSALALLGLGTYVAVSRGTGDSAPTASGTIEGFPSGIERDAITSIEITRQGEPAIRLSKVDGHWRVSAPVDAPADETAVSTAVDKIVELELESVAARSNRHHSTLEVDAEHGLRVTVRGGETTLADFWLGTSRSGNTALRMEGQDAVAMAHGSLGFAFRRSVSDWRDRRMTDLESDQVRDVAWVGPNGSFHFTRPMTTPAAAEGQTEAPAPSLGDWTVADVSYVPPADPDAGIPQNAPPVTTLEGFQPSRVRTLVSTLSRLRAADFAPAEITREAAGISDASSRVTLTIGEGNSAQRTTLRLGNASESNFYAMVDGNDTVFLVSGTHASRLAPNASEFIASAAPAEAPPEMPSMPGMPGGGGAGGGEIPPEIMRQIQQQLQQQGMQ